MKYRWLILMVCFLTSFAGVSQNADFTIPDTICEGKPVQITNVEPTSAISYQWSFCSGNASNDPDGVNTGNPGQLLNAPNYITLVKDGMDYFTFTTSPGNGKVVRCFYGTSLSHFPLLITDLGNFGILTDQVAGIQVKKDNGTWYGFVVNGDALVKLVFGTSPSNTPAFQVISLPGMVQASGLTIVRQDADWVGLCTDIAGSNLFRLDFGTNLGSDPLVTSLGNAVQLNSPAGIVAANENDTWYAFICNTGNSTLSRINFGPSLLNNSPAGTAITNIGSLNMNSGIMLINDCGGMNGFVTNSVIESNLCIIRLVFDNGLGGAITGYQIPNKGVLNKPFGISEFFRQGYTLFAFIANSGSSSLTRMFFPSCSGASQPFYSGPDPPPVIYPDAGNYNILLTVDDNLSTQSSSCKNIVVMPKPGVSLGPDQTLCQGMSTLLDAGPGDSLYIWSTGENTRTITVDATGTYWVHAINYWNCEAFDTIMVSVNKTEYVVVDTTICSGLSYWAQHGYQTVPGLYHDTLVIASSGCDSIVTTKLEVKDCSVSIWFPNAFTPDGDGLNDFFKPVARDITKYTMEIYDRWGALVFMTSDINTGWDGMVKETGAMPAVYTFMVVFESTYYPGVTHRKTGTFTLVR